MRSDRRRAHDDEENVGHINENAVFKSVSAADSFLALPEAMRARTPRARRHHRACHAALAAGRTALLTIFLNIVLSLLLRLSVLLLRCYYL